MRKVGGLKLIDASKTGFQPIYEMLNNSNSQISILTVSSLKGFMLDLFIPENESLYTTLNESKQLTKKVSNFIFKIAVTSPKNNTKLPNFNSYSKATETTESFFEEAKLQQMIWEKSIQGGNREICPSVANFTLFDNNNSTFFLSFLKTRNTNNEFQTLMDYLIYITSNVEYAIGVIVMPKMNNSFVLERITDSSREYRAGFFSDIIAQIVRLFLVIKVIHFDLHTGNVLLYLFKNKIPSSDIIDFGRASNLSDNKADEYLDIEEKQFYLENIKKQFDNLFVEKTDEMKAKYMKNTMYFISENVKIINREMYSYEASDEYQMMWYNNYDFGDYIYVNAFNIFYNDVVVDANKQIKITNKTIRKYKQEGKFVNFERNIADFYYNFPNKNYEPLVFHSYDMDIGGSKKRKTNKKKKKGKKRKTKKLFSRSNL
jgi:hypothetical protein